MTCGTQADSWGYCGFDLRLNIGRTVVLSLLIGNAVVLRVLTGYAVVLTGPYLADSLSLEGIWLS